MVPGPAPSASSGDLLGIQIRRSGPQPTEPEPLDSTPSFLSFSKPGLCCWCMLKFEDIAYEVRVAGSNSEVTTDLILSPSLTCNISNDPRCSSERWGDTLLGWVSSTATHRSHAINLDWSVFNKRSRASIALISNSIYMSHFRSWTLSDILSSVRLVFVLYPFTHSPSFPSPHLSSQLFSLLPEISFGFSNNLNLSKLEDNYHFFEAFS